MMRKEREGRNNVIFFYLFVNQVSDPARIVEGEITRGGPEDSMHCGSEL